MTKMDCSKKQIKNLKGIEYFFRLKKLDCSYNQLTSLDVSKNVKLGRLDCPHNQLTSLDVSKNAELYYDPQITNGTDAAHFNPNSDCTLAQIVTFLWKFAGSPEPKTAGNPFTDVKEGKFYYKAVLWAVENKITNGASADLFGVGKTCTRGKIVTFLYNFME